MRSVTVVEGAFAPGHLGELTQHIPFELVDAVLEETRTVERRLRLLPSRVGVYFVLALSLFPQIGYARVWSKSVAGLDGLPVLLRRKRRCVICGDGSAQLRSRCCSRLLPTR